MDFISHALWAAIAAKLINFRRHINLNIWFTALMGAMPDVFSFAPIFAVLIFRLGTGTFNPADFTNPEDFEPPQADTIFINRLTNILYNISHSLIVFIFVFVLLMIIFRRPILELGGWMMHILIDIPTHSFQFYPTPFLWPLSDWRFDGFSWADPWFLAINYLAVVLVFLLLRQFVYRGKG